MRITLSEAVEEAIKRKITVGKLEELGFDIDLTAGTSNVEAKVAKPEFDTKPELVAAAVALFNAGVKRAKTGSGRPKRTLGTKEGTYPYAVSISIDPSYKA